MSDTPPDAPLDVPAAPLRSRFRGAVIVSVIVLVTYGVVLSLVLTRSIPEGQRELALVVVGGLTAKMGDVVAYWVGSSDGSSEKTSIIRARQS